MYSLYARLTCYFCWLCDARADPRQGGARHYETGQPVRFCSPEHRAAYLWLACL